MSESNQDYSKYIEAWRKRLARAEEGRKEYHRKALEFAKKTARRLKGEFGAQQVYLFGTCIDESRFRFDSDIDLAVVGIKPEDFFKAWAAVERDSEFIIDLVDLETAPLTLKRRVEEMGVKIDA